MAHSTPLELALLPGARALLAAHARALPQRDDLCGAFCGSLALAAAGMLERDGEPLDQDAVALRAGSLLARDPEPAILPHGERGRRDYRLQLPLTDDAHASGTAAAGVVRALGELSGGRLAAIPFIGPWTPATLGRLLDAGAAIERPVTLIANLATHHLWGGRASPAQLLDHLLDGALDGPPPDWRVGHFVCVFGRLAGPGGSLYGVADTYPSLGRHGVHVQPAPLLAAALERREGPAGGIVAVVCADDAPSIRREAAAGGLREGLWDNGTPAQAPPA